MTTHDLLRAAKKAWPALAAASEAQKNAALAAMADALMEQSAAILAANALDMEAARGTISEVMLDRLLLTEARVAAMAEGVRERLHTDMAVSVTGLAGPDGDGVHEVGTVFIGLAVDGKTYVRETRMGTFRTRSFIRRMAGNHAFDMMRRYMSGLKVE